MCGGFVNTIQFAKTDSVYRRKMWILNVTKSKARDQDKQGNISLEEMGKDPLILFPKQVSSLLNFFIVTNKMTN